MSRDKFHTDTCQFWENHTCTCDPITELKRTIRHPDLDFTDEQARDIATRRIIQTLGELVGPNPYRWESILQHALDDVQHHRNLTGDY